MERTKIAWASCAFYIFCICGCIGFLPDMDHFWDIFGLQAPINLSGWNSRPLHVSLVFIVFGFLSSSIVVALTNGSRLGKYLALLDERIARRISPICGSIRDEFDYNISNNSMVVLETFGIPERGMSVSTLQDGVFYVGFSKGIFKVYRQTTLEEFEDG